MLLNLKINILLRYKSQRDFAREIGITDVRLSRLINERRKSSNEEKRVIVEKLRPEYAERLFVSI
jgi:plasmid maintenance system antidote protein VapI